ncbi:PIN domain-containing protein [Parabacteroides sp. 52]|uniref:type II toxin-antitoxin system VapC family toxin n=1 Tax=unclassified Parabacteroides TaxID=2649774 RepID=UPI0013D607A0|nr:MULTISPECIES: PIN domain-containing protein [unclassified Parabacteroides]MDH6533702.1 putative nucleic acid-binding protein [Parabacteroides sp. PM5-20]NDV54454.1 PIN domain-containing protein [Parabacteroides sp. 52]
MEKLLVDTNIVIDLLAKREDFYQEAQRLFTLADHREVKLFVSALTFANTYYLLNKYNKAEEARKILIKFKVLVEVLPLDDKIVELSLISDFKDYEDAIQYYSALENKLDMIITRNKKDFKTSILPVFTAKEYLKRNDK